MVSVGSPVDFATNALLMRVDKLGDERSAPWIKERKNAVKWTKLSCRRFKDNAARLQLFALAYNLANFLRRLVLPKPIQGCTLSPRRDLKREGLPGRAHPLHACGQRLLHAPAQSSLIQLALSSCSSSLPRWFGIITGVSPRSELCNGMGRSSEPVHSFVQTHKNRQKGSFLRARKYATLWVRFSSLAHLTSQTR
jgi:hypothetical protein